MTGQEQTQEPLSLSDLLKKLIDYKRTIHQRPEAMGWI